MLSTMDKSLDASLLLGLQSSVIVAHRPLRASTWGCIENFVPTGAAGAADRCIVLSDLLLLNISYLHA